MGLKINENRFWLLQDGDKIEMAFNDKNEAIKVFRDRIAEAKEVDKLELQEIQVADKGNYKISPVSWKDIALSFAKE